MGHLPLQSEGLINWFRSLFKYTPPAAHDEVTAEIVQQLSEADYAGCWRYSHRREFSPLLLRGPPRPSAAPAILPRAGLPISSSNPARSNVRRIQLVHCLKCDPSGTLRASGIDIFLSEFRSAIARSELKPPGVINGVTLGAAWHSTRSART